MPKRKFRLESVLRYRKSLERQWQAEVAGTLSMMIAEQKKRDDLMDARRTARRKMESDLSGGLDARIAGWYADFFRATDGRIDDSVLRSQELQKIFQQKQDVLLKATKNRKVMERLKEIEGERLSEEERIDERKQLDDFAGIQHQRG